jgi:hypothetical protein
MASFVCVCSGEVDLPANGKKVGSEWNRLVPKQDAAFKMVAL